MIRRNRPLGDAAPDNEPSHWLLIDQVDHAHLSGELASRAILPGSLLDGVWRNDVLFAIVHHDDGWQAWDVAPMLDPERGHPLGFTEMLVDHSLAIWRMSITTCGAQSPLAGYAVAGHFLRLLADSHHAEAEASLAWRRDIEQLQQQWLAKPSAPTVEVADEAAALVRAFDWLSLWLCCYCPAYSDDQTTMPTTELDSPAIGHSLSFSSSRPSGVAVDPFCFAESFRYDTPARLVTAGHYTNVVGMLLQCQPCELSWTFGNA